MIVPQSSVKVVAVQTPLKLGFPPLMPASSNIAKPSANASSVRGSIRVSVPKAKQSIKIPQAQMQAQGQVQAIKAKLPEKINMNVSNKQAASLNTAEKTNLATSSRYIQQEAISQQTAIRQQLREQTRIQTATRTSTRLNIRSLIKQRITVKTPERVIYLPEPKGPSRPKISIRERKRKKSLYIREGRTVLADLLSLAESQLKYGKATSPSVIKRPSVYQLSLRGGRVPTVEQIQAKKGRRRQRGLNILGL